MKDLMFEDNINIRTTVNNGETWFILRDVLEAMHTSTTTTAAIDFIKQGIGEGYISLTPFKTVGGTQNMIIINEYALTFLVAQSKTKKGKRFNRWLHTEVLPAIRKTEGFGKLLREIISALEAFDVPEGMEDMYVYAMKNTVTGNIKLGISKNPEERLKQLQTGNDCKLELVAYCKAKNGFSDETALHNKYSSVHIMGEWFEPTAINAIGA